jgi:hypothetical protein
MKLKHVIFGQNDSAKQYCRNGSNINRETNGKSSVAYMASLLHASGIS